MGLLYRTEEQEMGLLIEKFEVNTDLLSSKQKDRLIELLMKHNNP